MKITPFRSTPGLTCDECGHERRRRPVNLYRIGVGPHPSQWDTTLVLCRRCLRELKRQLRGVRT